MKNITLIILILLGGLIGFSIHYAKMHATTDISLFSIGPHAIEGTLYSLIGILVGGCVYYLLQKRK